MKITYLYEEYAYVMEKPVVSFDLIIDTSKKTAEIRSDYLSKLGRSPEVLTLTEKICKYIEENIYVYQLAFEALESDSLNIRVSTVIRIWIESDNNTRTRAIVDVNNSEGINVVSTFIDFLNEVLKDVRIKISINDIFLCGRSIGTKDLPFLPFL